MNFLCLPAQSRPRFGLFRRVFAASAACLPGRLWVLLPLLLLLPLPIGCNRTESYPARPLTIICPWAAGGGTDRVSRQLALLLEQELGTPVSVVNATGGKGVTGHNRGLRARPDGYTLAMITFELNTMHWMGLTELSYKDCIPLLSFNEDYAALLVRSEAPWQSLQELEAEVASAPRQLTASGTAIGGAWHLALAGWLLAAGLEADAITWIPSEGSNPSLQQLLSGGVDIVCCSLPEARTLLEAGQVRSLGVMSPERAQGFESIATFPEQGREWTLGGWRGLAVPLHTPPEIVQRLVAVLTRVVSQEATPGSFAEFMSAQKFDHTWRDPQEFADFLASNDAKLGELLTSEAMQSVSRDRFSPLAYPYLLLALLGVCLVGVAVEGLRHREHQAPPEGLVPAPLTARGVFQFAAVLLAVLLYVLLAETVGFVLLSGAMLLGLLLLLGTRLLPSMIIVLLFVPSVYFLFAVLLRVPLPRGWLG